MEFRIFATPRATVPGRTAIVIRTTLAGVLLAAAGTGCSGPQSETPGVQDTADTRDGDLWFVTYVMGAKVGYQHSRYTQETRDGRKLIRTDSLSHLVMKRGPSRVEMDVACTDWTTPDGRLVEFTSRLSQLGTSITSRGKAVGGKLAIETTTQGKTVTSTISLPNDCRGFSAVEQSLASQPMKPGEKRTFRALLPVFNQVGIIELVAKDQEQTKLLTGSYELLRIESATRFPDGQVTRDTIWTDRTGLPLKIYSRAMDSEMYLTTREVAEDKEGLGEIDFNLDIAVPVNRPLRDPHRTKKVRYRISLERGDPTSAFVSARSQRVEPRDAHTADVTVYSLRPGRTTGNPDATTDPPQPADREPNNLIQSDDPQIVAAAEEAVRNEKDPWKRVLALERYVNGYVTEKNYTKAFATASDVLKSREGDCTEHAVLLAALARAVGIPARVAVGLVYQDGRFFFHMWNEVYVDKTWIPVDATLARGGIGAAHLKLAQSNLEGSSAFSAFLPVAQVLGRGLKIEILNAE